MTQRITVAAAIILATLVACQRLQPADALLKQARDYQAQGNVRAAIIQSKNAIEQQPDDGAARLLLGQLYVDQGDAVPAEKELRRALALRQARSAVLPVLAKALLMQGAYQRLLDEMAGDPPGGRVLSLRGEALLGLGQFPAAREMFAQALALEPRLVPALLGMAQVAMASGAAQEAVQKVDQAIAIDPRDMATMRFKGDLLRAQGQLDGARQAYEAILALAPNRLQVHIDLAHLALQSGQPEQARARIAAARKLQPNSLVVYHAQALLDFNDGKYKMALEQVQQILRTAPDHGPSLLLAGAVELMLDSPAQARLHLQAFLSQQPGNAHATRLLAALALRGQQADEALRLLQPLIEKPGDDGEALAMAGEAALRLRRFELAANYFERASTLRPDAPMLQAAHGLSRLGAGENMRAVAELEGAAAKDGAASRAGVLLVMTHLRAKDFAKAMQLVESMQQQGDNPMVQNLKAGVQLASGDLHGARASFGRALAFDPLYQPALENLAQLDLMEKKPAQARERFLTALKKDPQRLALLMALAKLAVNQDKPAEAIGWLEQAVTAHPAALPPVQLLTQLYMRGGQGPKALALAQKAQSNNPGNDIALALLANAQATAGKHEQALDSYGKLAALQPAAAAVQLRIAAAYLALRHPEPALEAARKALRLEPGREDAAALAMSLLLDRKAYGEAQTLALDIQRRQPAVALGFRLEGDVLQARGLMPDAVQSYERAYALQSSGPLLIALHRAQRAVGKGAQGNKKLQQWLDKNPADQATRLYYASVMLEDRHYAAAAIQYEQILKRDADQVLALNDLAWAYLQLKDRRALGNAERAYKLAPRNPAVLDTLAAALAEQGALQRALPLLKQAVDQAPAVPDIRLRYAQMLFRTGDKGGARQQCQTLLALPDLAQRDAVQALMARL